MTLDTTNRAPGPAATPLRHVEKCMGTVFSFHLAAPGIERADLAPILAWLHAMDALFSTYRSDSQITALNAGRLRLSDTDQQVRDVLGACDEMRRLSDGYFDPRPDGCNLDPSGYVKGWAIQTASDLLGAAGSINHCVNGGGDVICVGEPEPGRDWRIGVADPHRREVLARTIVGPGPIAVATSGLAERGAHIRDPHTRLPVTELASVTVAAPDLVTADVYATAAVAMGTERAARWLTRRTGITAVLIPTEGHPIDIAPDGTC